MTFEQLMGTSLEIQEKMSDSELESYFFPFFQVTRPSKEAREVLVRNTPEDPKRQAARIARKQKEDLAARAQKLLDTIGF